MQVVTDCPFSHAPQWDTIQVHKPKRSGAERGSIEVLFRFRQALADLPSRRERAVSVVAYGSYSPYDRSIPQSGGAAQASDW